MKACEQMLALYPRLKDDAALQSLFRQALISARQFTRVEPLLAAADFERAAVTVQFAK